jgi:hypothetical protein
MRASLTLLPMITVAVGLLLMLLGLVVLRLGRRVLRSRISIDL